MLLKFSIMLLYSLIMFAHSPFINELIFMLSIESNVALYGCIEYNLAISSWFYIELDLIIPS